MAAAFALAGTRADDGGPQERSGGRVRRARPRSPAPAV